MRTHPTASTRHKDYNRDPKWIYSIGEGKKKINNNKYYFHEEKKKKTNGIHDSHTIACLFKTVLLYKYTHIWPAVKKDKKKEGISEKFEPVL